MNDENGQLNIGLNSLALRTQFAHWEAGFDMYDAGRPVEHCKVFRNAKATKTRTEGWNAARLVAELAADTNAALAFTRNKNKFTALLQPE